MELHGVSIGAMHRFSASVLWLLSYGYVTLLLTFSRTYLFRWGHELANSFLLFKVQKSESFDGVCMKSHGVYMEFHGVSWSSMEFAWSLHGVPWSLHGVCMEFA